MTAGQLPQGFEALEPFVEAWAIAGAANRVRRRIESTEEERNAFFNAAKDLLDPALAYLDRKPLHQFEEPEKQLMNLMLTFAHISIAVEVQRDIETKQAWGRRFMTVTRAPSDVNS